MIIFDAHCDTLTKIMEQNSNLYSNNCHVDIERMKKSGSFVQFFAAFIDPIYSYGNTLKRAMQIIDKFYEQLNLYNDSIMLCCNYRDIKNALDENKIAALLSIEGGEALQGDLSTLRNFYRLGVRSICLTWNYRNEIADGVKDDITGGGLTRFGREVIKEMNSLKMLIDLSHISENGFWNVLELTSAPVVVSHSNAKKICSHKRNLSDEQILAIKENGGVIGINLYPDFLNDSGKATVKDAIKHIEHMSGLIGTENIGIGADFDGIECTPDDIQGVQDIIILLNELARLNYSNETIANIMGNNFLGLVKKIL